LALSNAGLVRHHERSQSLVRISNTKCISRPIRLFPATQEFKATIPCHANLEGVLDRDTNPFRMPSEARLFDNVVYVVEPNIDVVPVRHRNWLSQSRPPGALGTFNRFARKPSVANEPFNPFAYGFSRR